MCMCLYMRLHCFDSYLVSWKAAQERCHDVPCRRKLLRFLVGIHSKTLLVRKNFAEKSYTCSKKKGIKSARNDDTLFSFSLPLRLSLCYRWCRSCTYPSIHLFMALTLKITVVRRAHIQAFSFKKHMHTRECCGHVHPC